MKQSLLPASALIAFSAAVSVINHRTPICGLKGYDRATEGYFYGNQGTYGGCSAECKKDSKNCKSFSFGNGECNLYAVAASSNLNQVSDSPYAFYESSCITLASSTSSVISTTSKIASTTSTTLIKTTTTNSKMITTTTKSTTSNTAAIKATSTSASVTKTTTKALSSTATSSTDTPPCPLPTFVVTNFRYFNSSHNADCANSRLDVGDGTGCLDPKGNWCDPNLDSNCDHCGIGVCYTGLGTQPVGYGPPDTVSADISNIGSCSQSNPGTTPRRPVSGGNVVRCGGSQIQWIFDGDSNSANSTAFFHMQNQYFCPDTKAYYTAYGQGQTAMSCSYDSGHNATCVLSGVSYAVPATRFDNVGYYGSDN